LRYTTRVKAGILSRHFVKEIAMPLFGRSDGTLVKNLAPVRAMIPYLMLGRNESIVYHEEIVELTKTLSFLERWNAVHERKLTVFHLLVAGCAHGLWARPGLNRFVSGKRIYERKGVQISFAAKMKFKDEAPLVTVKIEAEKDEPVMSLVDKLYGSVGEGRSGKTRTVDKELKLALALPSWLLSIVMGRLRWLDSVNLLPASMIKSDPMYASVFLGNLGSVGIDRTWHHLYEYGNISLFGVLGTIRKYVMVDDNNQPVVRDAVSVRWSFDERINDGFYTAASMKLCGEVMVDPERFLGEELAKAGAAVAS
jgi:hypothetical protein